MNNVATKAEIQETVVESLVGSLSQAKAEAEQHKQQGLVMGHIIRALVGAVSDDGTFLLTPEQVKAANDTVVNWQLGEDGSIALATME